ncbi:MAG: transporter [Rhizobiaceae bacterium]|nr:MAG: transporter [Rhizobiaceae bacterium]
MPPFEYVQRHLAAAWRMMNGKADGVRALDISADGFWNSFFGIVVALPPLIVSWVSYADLSQDLSEAFRDRMAVVAKLAVIDLASWVVPIIGLALVVKRIGLSDRFVHYVIAGNWSTAIIAWLMVPPSIVLLFAPDTREFASLLSLVLFILSLVFDWRMTNAALGKGAVVASGLFASMVAASLAILMALQWLFDIQ